MMMSIITACMEINPENEEPPVATVDQTFVLILGDSR